MNKRLIFKNGKKEIVERKNFKDLLKEKKIIRLIGAHNALTAFLAEEAGFEGVWLSSFELHASARFPDADILTTSDYSNIINKMEDRIVIPLMVDGDAGGGSVINTIRMVREYEKNGAVGLCIEDNKYPKRCSFYSKTKDKLENPKFHASKIKAACDNRINKDFLIVARLESFIVGNGLNDAIERANLYVEAGADCILVHNKETTPDLIFEFSQVFKKDVPLICVPTTYNTVHEKELYDNGYRIIIYANYGIRSIVKSLQETLKLIADSHSLSSANDRVVPMSEIFRIVAVEELYKNEKKYME